MSTRNLSSMILVEPFEYFELITFCLAIYYDFMDLSVLN